MAEHHVRSKSTVSNQHTETNVAHCGLRLGVHHELESCNNLTEARSGASGVVAINLQRRRATDALDNLNRRRKNSGIPHPRSNCTPLIQYRFPSNVVSRYGQ